MIAFDSKLDRQDHSGTGPFTDNFTNTAGNIVFVCIACSVGVNSVSGITYSGQSMTLWKSQLSTGNFDLYVFALINAPTGANNIVTTLTGSDSIRVFAISYSGAQTSNTPDNSSGGSTGASTSLSQSLTTIADNCWVLLFAGAGNTQTATSGCVLRVSSTNPAIFDNNTAITPPNTITETVNSGGTSDVWCYIMLSFAPTAISGGTGRLSASTRLAAVGRITATGRLVATGRLRV